MDTGILRGIFMKIDPQFCRVDDGLDTILGKWKIPIILYLLKKSDYAFLRLAKGSS